MDISESKLEHSVYQNNDTATRQMKIITSKCQNPVFWVLFSIFLLINSVIVYLQIICLNYRLYSFLLENCCITAFKQSQKQDLGAENKTGRKGRMPVYMCQGMQVWKTGDKGCLHIVIQKTVLHTYPTYINRK